jgi:fructose PTS system EIIBC or EIIC component
MTLGHFTEPTLLVPRLLSETQPDVIMELAKRLARAARIHDPEDFVLPVLEREDHVPTLIGDGVALPHARGSGVSALSLAVGFSKTGIPWPDRNAVVHVVFMSAIPFAETQSYLALLAGLSKLIQDETLFTRLKSAARPEKILAVLDSVEIAMPERLQC